jgi:hypothetical protein
MAFASFLPRQVGVWMAPEEKFLPTNKRVRKKRPKIKETEPKLSKGN